MASYCVTLSGAGISVPSDHDPIIGFFTSRKVRGSTEDEAIEKAKEVVLAEWVGGGEYADINEGRLPTLMVEEIRQLGLFETLFPRFSIRGYTFYQKE